MEPNHSTNNIEQQRKYGDATSIVCNMLQEIKQRNKDAVLVDLITQCCDVANGQKQYIEECAFLETELQQRIGTDTRKDERAALGINMLSGPLEGNFLKLMAEMAQAKTILDIGMYTGYSAVTLAGSEYCENLVTLDVEPYYESFLKLRLAGSKLASKVRILIGPAEESLRQLKVENMQFDFVFLDANKGGYLDYYKYIMANGLLNPTGVIACDNVLWYGRTFNQSTSTGKILHKFVEFVKNDNRVYQVILPIRDGILMIKPNIQHI